MGGALAPSSHTTVHTVRYTAVQSHKCSSPLLARVLRLCYAPVFPIAVCVCAFAFWTFCDIIMAVQNELESQGRTSQCVPRQHLHGLNHGYRFIQLLNVQLQFERIFL